MILNDAGRYLRMMKLVIELFRFYNGEQSSFTRTKKNQNWKIRILIFYSHTSHACYSFLTQLALQDVLAIHLCSAPHALLAMYLLATLVHQQPSPVLVGCVGFHLKLFSSTLSSLRFYSKYETLAWDHVT